MNERFWYLKRCPLFEQLTADEIARIEAVSFTRKFQKGNLIYMPADAGESVFLLTSGRVKLYHVTSEGKHAVLAWIEPGELFGELALFDRSPREEFAEAMEASVLIKIPQVEVQRLMEQRPQVALGVTRLIGLRRRRIERRLKSLLFRSNRERLIHLLVELAEQYGIQTPEGVKIGIRLSHQDLAGIIGSTRETVTVVLGELQSEGALTILRRQLVLKSLEGLARSVDLEPPRLPLPASPLGVRP